MKRFAQKKYSPSRDRERMSVTQASAFATGTLVPVEFGGTADTQTVFRLVHDELTRHPVTADLTA
jgi:hypothetical protein